MKFHEKLKEKQKKKLETIRRQKITAKDIEELMGVNRDTYKRNRGAIRRK